MTVSSTVRKAGPFTGNGSTSTFPFSFKVFIDQDLEVVWLPAATGIEHTLVLDSDYSVALNTDQDSSPGGSITLLAGPLASGDTLVITTDIPELQQADITNGGGFYPEVITDALDYVTILVQQLVILAESSLRFPLSDDPGSTELPAASQRANKVLGFGPDGSVSMYAGGFQTMLSRANGGLSGSLDGTNRTFSMPYIPFFPQVSLLCLSGSILPHELYTISGNTVTINTPVPPQRGDTIELYCS